jgi:hypothetical protein
MNSIKFINLFFKKYKYMKGENDNVDAIIAAWLNILISF